MKDNISWLGPFQENQAFNKGKDWFSSFWIQFLSSMKYKETKYKYLSLNTKKYML